MKLKTTKQTISIIVIFLTTTTKSLLPKMRIGYNKNYFAIMRNKMFVPKCKTISFYQKVREQDFRFRWDNVAESVAMLLRQSTANSSSTPGGCYQNANKITTNNNNIATINLITCIETLVFNYLSKITGDQNRSERRARKTGQHCCAAQNVFFRKQHNRRKTIIYISFNYKHFSII
jgi:hypothetical protein